MNECNRCRKIFESPVERFEADTGYRERTCPYCGDDDISEAHECPICHTNYTSEDFCQECYDTVNQSLTELKEKLGATQEDFEDIISNNFGW